MKQEWIPGTVDNPTDADMFMIRNLSQLLEEKARLLAIHLREIANNERYHHHKRVLKARRREVANLRQVLDLIDQELRMFMGEDVQK